MRLHTLDEYAAKYGPSGLMPGDGVREAMLMPV